MVGINDGNDNANYGIINGKTAQKYVSVMIFITWLPASSEYNELELRIQKLQPDQNEIDPERLIGLLNRVRIFRNLSEYSPLKYSHHGLNVGNN